MTILLHDLVGRDEMRPFSPHCWKVRMALAHKGLDYDVSPTRFTGVKAIEGGPDRTAPVIRDGDKVIQDSFAIAEYLDDAYPDRPALFDSKGERGVARFMEAWALRIVHPAITAIALMDIFSMLDEPDRVFFRQTREKRFGRPLEEVPSGRTEEKLAALHRDLQPLRETLSNQPFVGGETPRFVDYIAFGPFQWLRVTADFPLLASDDPIQLWFERCLDLHGGAGRSVPPAQMAAAA